jgi:ankyrin repeat protein
VPKIEKVDIYVYLVFYFRENTMGTNMVANKRLEECMYMGYPGSALTAISEGADINIKDKHGNSVLHFACSYSFWPLVEKYLEGGLDINALNLKGVTPLECITGSPELSAPGIVYALLKAGADPTLGYPVHNAAYQGNIDIVQSLWWFGADLDLTDKNGRTAGQLAAMNGQLRLSILIDDLKMRSKKTLFLPVNSK